MSKGKNKRFLTIRICLLKEGMTIKNLAETLGLSISGVNKKLTGTSEWNLEELIIMSKKFGISIDELIA